VRRLLAAAWRAIFSPETYSPAPARRRPAPRSAETTYPDGWPEGYASAEVEPGRHVVVIRGKRTSAPRFFDEESARRDAWERRWSEEADGHAVLCPECLGAGQRSTVQATGASLSTAIYCPPFHDTRGKLHVHDRNVTTTRFRCSAGHEFKREGRRSCWCGWPDQEPQR
jgi:hypothetical protein